MNQQLMPSIWKGHTNEGTVSHRIQIIGDDNKPVMFCSKANIDHITHIMDRFAGALCLRCPWEQTKAEWGEVMRERYNQMRKR